MKSSIFMCLAASLLIALTGCKFSPLQTENDDNQITVEDGNAGTASFELQDMGDAAMELWGTARENLQDTINIDITIIPWHYDTTVKGWIRAAEGILEGGEVTRYDTLWFYDASGNTKMIPSMATTASYRHVRSVHGTYYNTFNYRYEMNVTIEKGAADTVFVFNGTINGEFNGESIDNTVISNVKRRLIHLPFRWLSFPYEGTISIDRPLFSIYVEFGGAQTAKVTVTRKSDGKTWVYTINITTGRPIYK